MLSDPTLFTRSDEVEAAWKLYTPLIELMDNSPWKLPIYNYESMTWGPPESDQLISKDNIFWRRLKNETSTNTSNPFRAALSGNF